MSVYALVFLSSIIYFAFSYALYKLWYCPDEWEFTKFETFSIWNLFFSGCVCCLCGIILIWSL